MCLAHGFRKEKSYTFDFLPFSGLVSLCKYQKRTANVIGVNSQLEEQESEINRFPNR